MPHDLPLKEKGNKSEGMPEGKGLEIVIMIKKPAKEMLKEGMGLEQYAKSKKEQNKMMKAMRKDYPGMPDEELMELMKKKGMMM